MPVAHAFTSAIANEISAGRVRPTDWNAGHVVSVDLTSEVTGDLPFVNIAQLTSNSIAARAVNSTGDIAAFSVNASSLIGRDGTSNLTNIVNGFGLSLTGGQIFVDVAAKYDWTGTHSFTKNNFLLKDAASANLLTLNVDALGADRIILVPALTANDTFSVLGLAQTFSQTQTFGAGTNTNYCINLDGTASGSSLAWINFKSGGTNYGTLSMTLGFVGFTSPNGIFSGIDTSNYHLIVSGAQSFVTAGTHTFTGAVALTGLTTTTGGFIVSTNGMLISDVNCQLGTTTGTKFGTATNQKMGWWNATPVIQQVLTSTAGYTVTNLTTDRAYDANSTTLDEIADFLGTLAGDFDDLRTKIRNTGILA